MLELRDLRNGVLLLYNVQVVQFTSVQVVYIFYIFLDSLNL
jgi:hypothetical protein